jgi:hypothetical protein
MVEEPQLTTVGGIDGHDYFLLVKDERRGDDRSMLCSCRPRAQI